MILTDTSSLCVLQKGQQTYKFVGDGELLGLQVPSNRGDIVGGHFNARLLKGRMGTFKERQ